VNLVTLVQTAFWPANLAFHASPVAVTLREAKAKNAFGFRWARIRGATGAVRIWSPGWVISRRAGFAAVQEGRVSLRPEHAGGGCATL
jgi:hypothetical protein